MKGLLAERVLPQAGVSFGVGLTQEWKEWGKDDTGVGVFDCPGIHDTGITEKERKGWKDGMQKNAKNISAVVVLCTLNAGRIVPAEMLDVGYACTLNVPVYLVFNKVPLKTHKELKGDVGGATEEGKEGGGHRRGGGRSSLLHQCVSDTPEHSGQDETKQWQQFFHGDISLFCL